MGQFSVEKPVLPGSVLSGNQHSMARWKLVRSAWASRANQRVEVELLAIDASPHGLRALAIAIGAPHVHPPAEASRDA